MEILLTILVYVLAVLVPPFADLILMLFWPVIPLIKRSAVLSSSFLIATHGIVGVLAVWIVTLACVLLGVKCTVLMWAIIFILSMNNGRKRLQRARSGISSTAIALRRNGQTYDSRVDTRLEWSMIIGDFIGLTIGFNLFFANAPFI